MDAVRNFSTDALGPAGFAGGGCPIGPVFLHEASQTSDPTSLSDRELLDLCLDSGMRDFLTVPCSITDSWHCLAATAHREGTLRLVTTNHEGNLPGIAAGIWFGTGRPALVHLQNTGLFNAGDGLLTLAGRDVYHIPMAVMLTWRGADDAEESEPHIAIGKQTDALCEALFGRDRTFGSGDGASVRGAMRGALRAALRGELSVMRLSPSSLRRTQPLELPAEPPLARAHDLERLRSEKGAGSVSGPLRSSKPLGRDEAIRHIVDDHSGAAILFCNGFTSRAARALADRPGNFYNLGYMGGTLAIGWGLANALPNLEVVVVDGDQNALMSTMKDQLLATYPDNLHWYVLNNGIGASVGVAESLPLSPLYDDLARVIPTVPDSPGSFQYPRVKAAGTSTEAKGRHENETLTGLARDFRRWVAHQSGG